ncbi:MAG: winged helix-turn-helix domain-containing protein [Egibacteraceae bacterium]
MQFRVLGSLEVRRGDAPVAIGSRRQRAVLAALLADVGQVVPVDALTEALWGAQPPADPRNAIQTYVARLREQLGPGTLIVTRAPGYALEVEPHEVDARCFEQLLDEAQRRKANPQRCGSCSTARSGCGGNRPTRSSPTTLRGRRRCG